MSKCSQCKLMVRKIYGTIDTGNFYECGLDGDWISAEVALDETYGCEFFVPNICNDDAKKGDQ